ncbi:hypothetical protein [Kribbella sp. NPDC006257]|uniref:hypothetical protein n=1 Tax=Kribbella sp. NPDC006257 TaxID=3156738 RepID=UPI0033A784C3
MTQAPRCALLTSILVAGVLLTGCGGSSPTADSKPPTSTPTASTTPTTPATTPSQSKAPKAFCQDLVTLDYAVVKYSADAVTTALGRGEPVPLAELKRVSGIAVDLGRQLLRTAPADVRKDLLLVVQAVSASAAHLKPGHPPAKVIEPILRKTTLAAEKRLEQYAGCTP